MSARGGALYLEIESWLRTRVLNGREGDPLPSEAELATQFGVSRMTARQAVQNLASEGLVRRRRGSGTFIAPQPLHRHSGPLTSFTVDMRGRGLTPSSILLTAELREASTGESEALRLDAGVRVVSLVRLRLADDAPMAIEHTTLTPDAAPVLAQDLEAGSLHDALRNLGREPTTAVARISARPATSEESRLLQLKPRAVVLVEQRVITDQDSRELEFTTTVYNASRYVLDATFMLADPGDRPAVS
ncbi:GntR family transcriptional regulator [Microbacterium sp. DT81.1]|uniref:GntR family transcriptional regulator n=1 Tax=Microbacterium sp. DT81.1 TaxID=3393413 RepID=UPI003CF1FBA8